MDTMTAVPKGIVMPTKIEAADITGLNDQCAELLRRVTRGTVPLGVAARAIQAGIENKLETIISEPQFVFDRFTPVEQYQAKIRARAQLREWQINPDQLAAIGQATDYHAGPLEPTSIKLWLGRDLAYNIGEALAWLKDELVAAGIDLEWYNYLKEVSLSWLSGSETQGDPSLTITKLDFQTFWDRTNGLIPNEVRPQRSYWPGLEVIWFLALNPQYCQFMDGDTTPFLMAPGLVVRSEGVPGFDRLGRRFFVYSLWADSRWFSTAMVAERE